MVLQGIWIWIVRLHLAAVSINGIDDEKILHLASQTLGVLSQDGTYPINRTLLFSIQHYSLSSTRTAITNLTIPSTVTWQSE